MLVLSKTEACSNPNFGEVIVVFVRTKSTPSLLSKDLVAFRQNMYMQMTEFSTINLLIEWSLSEVSIYIYFHSGLFEYDTVQIE
jgi:hypothetical protein